MKWPTENKLARRAALFGAQVLLAALLAGLGVSQACVAELQGVLPALVIV